MTLGKAQRRSMLVVFVATAAVWAVMLSASWPVGAGDETPVKAGAYDCQQREAEAKPAFQQGITQLKADLASGEISNAEARAKS